MRCDIYIMVFTSTRKRNIGNTSFKQGVIKGEGALWCSLLGQNFLAGRTRIINYLSTYIIKFESSDIFIRENEAIRFRYFSLRKWIQRYSNHEKATEHSFWKKHLVGSKQRYLGISLKWTLLTILAKIVVPPVQGDGCMSRGFIYSQGQKKKVWTTRASIPLPHAC